MRLGRGHIQLRGAEEFMSMNIQDVNANQVHALSYICILDFSKVILVIIL